MSASKDRRGNVRDYPRQTGLVEKFDPPIAWTLTSDSEFVSSSRLNAFAKVEKDWGMICSRAGEDWDDEGTGRLLTTRYGRFTGHYMNTIWVTLKDTTLTLYSPKLKYVIYEIYICNVQFMR